MTTEMIERILSKENLEEAKCKVCLLYTSHPDYTEEQIAMKMISKSFYPATLRNKERLNEENEKFPFA